MVNTFFAILLWVLFCVFVASFLGWVLAKRRVRYEDWARQERRKILMNSVRTVREEEGDYLRAATSKSGVPKSKATARRPARRGVRR